MGSGVLCVTYVSLRLSYVYPQGGEEQLVLRTLNDVKSAYLAVYFMVFMM